MISPKRTRLTLSTTMCGGCDDNNNSNVTGSSNKHEPIQQRQSTNTIPFVVSHTFVLSLILLLLFVTVAITDAQIQQLSIITKEIDNNTITRLKTIDNNTAQHEETTKKQQTNKYSKYNPSSSTAIQDYLNLLQISGRKHIAIFKWNPDGTLSNDIIFPIVPKGDRIPTWFQNYYSEYDKIHNSFNTTSKSVHGKVAMMYGWDVFSFVLLKPSRIPYMDPPIPMFVYTTPQRRLHDQVQVEGMEQFFIRQNDNGINETISWITTPHIPRNSQTHVNDTGSTIITNNIIHIPNPYDYSGFSQHSVDKILYNNTFLYNSTYEKFHDRSNVLLWRGSDHQEIARQHLVSMSQDLQSDVQDNNTNNIWLDAKFTSKRGTETKMVEFVKEVDLVLQYKYHLDVGGCSGTSWGGLRWKLCTGNTVFMVDSSMNEWWYQYLIPYIHYIPIKEDLSNLYEQYIWVENNPIQAYTIAKAGQEICLQTYTVADAIEYTKPIIEQLPDATVQQIEEYDVIYLQHQQQRQQQEQEQ